MKQNLNLTVNTRVDIFNLLQVYQLGYWAIQSLVQYSPCKIQPGWVEGLHVCLIRIHSTSIPWVVHIAKSHQFRFQWPFVPVLVHSICVIASNEKDSFRQRSHRSPCTYIDILISRKPYGSFGEHGSYTHLSGCSKKWVGFTDKESAL